MTKTVTTLLAALTLLACGGSPPPKPAAPPPPPPKTLADVTDAMCACQDPACADKVHADLAAVIGDASRDRAPHTDAQRAAIAACEATARGGDELATMKRMDDALCACHDAACVDRVQKDFAAFMQRMVDEYEGKRPPDEPLMRLGRHMAQCMAGAMSAGGAHGATGVDRTASSSPGPSGPVHTGVAACDAYLAAFDQFMTCDKIPQAAKDSSHQAIEEMKPGWRLLADPNVPAEARQEASQTCAQALDALRKSAREMGCSISDARRP